MNSGIYSVVIVGAGIFGVTAALELSIRGHKVTLIDPGPLPHPDAASTDISKVLRMDYGKDQFYWELMMDAFSGWDSWNSSWEKPLFHQTGFLMLSRNNWNEGGFEFDSYTMAEKLGVPVKRLYTNDIQHLYPAWKAVNYPNGYFNPRAGWAESGSVVAKLIELCKTNGVILKEGLLFDRLTEGFTKITGVRTVDGQHFEADYIIISAGAWTPTLLPDLQDRMWATGQPVFHFKAPDLELFQPPNFPVWNADIAQTGWYGFPAMGDGTIKVANHGPGYRVDPRKPRVIPASEEERFRQFFSETFPALVEAPKIGERLCLYCDTWDGNFWIDHDPDRPGLIVAAGGSGHGFKFAPILGKITADVLERKENKYSKRFGWRERGNLTAEDARFIGDTPRK